MRLTRAQQERLLDPAVQSVLRQIEEKGGQARLVGGAVRDCLLEREIKERDIATTLSPAAVTQIFEKEGVKVVPTGIAFGTVTVVFEGVPYEITTLRKDVKTDGRHAVVTFSNDWAEDAKRRDFTINALSVDRVGALYDYEEGLRDLKEKRLRFIGKPEVRLAEDYLRLLRLFRFWATLAGFEPGGEDLEAATQAAPHLSALSAERITQELRKLLAGENAFQVAPYLVKRQILSAVLKSPADLSSFVLYCQTEEKAGMTQGWLFRLAVLFPSAGKADLARLSLSRKELQYLENLRRAEKAGPLDARILAHRHGKEAALALLLKQGKAKEALRIVTWDIPVFPVQGRDLIAEGVHEGAQLGVILKKAEAWWESENFAPSKEACLKKALEFSGRSSDTSRFV